MSVSCDKFGFFNGIMGIEQGNWATFWDGIIPDGVIANQGDELEVYAQADGLTTMPYGSRMLKNCRSRQLPDPTGPTWW